MRHGRIPIQDEFTNRRDLTPFQKWQLRHGKKPVNVGTSEEGRELLTGCQ